MDESHLTSKFSIGKQGMYGKKNLGVQHQTLATHMVLNSAIQSRYYTPFKQNAKQRN